MESEPYPDHEPNCPIRSPHPASCCTCGNPKAMKWNGERFHNPYYEDQAAERLADALIAALEPKT